MKPILYLSPKATREDVECLTLAKLGFPYKTIAKQTGLTESQVGYRLKLAGISPMDYRRGESELARRVMVIAHEDSKEFFNTIISNVKKFLKD